MRAFWAKNLRNPELWFVLFYNLLILYLFLSKELDPKFVIWSYFLQSLYVGGQYIIYKLTGDLDISWKEKVRPILFFTFHFGLFHFVYLIFILVLSFRNANGDGLELIDYVRWNALFLLGGLVLTLIREVAQGTPTHSKANVIVPYARIIPMHLVIILSMFFSLTNPWVFSIFVGLKTLGDVFLAIVFNGEDE